MKSHISKYQVFIDKIVQRPDLYTIEQLKEFDNFIDMNISLDTLTLDKSKEKRKFKRSHEKPKMIILKLENLKLDTDENIQKYCHLPLTHFRSIKINCSNSSEDLIDIGCRTLKAIFEQKHNDN